jgi:biotin transport system substrate-specific component
MSKAATQVFGQQIPALDWKREWAKRAAIVIGASLPFTPVPLTLQNFGVLTVGLFLGSRRGFAALALYLFEGALGMPVFSPSILGGGIAQLLGPTGGFLMAYPLVAFVAGWVYEKSAGRFVWAAVSSMAAELVLFAGGLGWLAVFTHSMSLALKLGLYTFVFAEVIKVLMAASVASRWSRRTSV